MHSILGVIAMGAIIYRNVPALIALKKGTFQPSSPTCFIWATISFIEAIIILSSHGGWAATSTVVTTIFCFFFGLKGIKFIKQQPVSVKFLGTMAFFIVVPTTLSILNVIPLSWLLIDLAIIEALAIIPTIKKIKKAPFSENLELYVWGDAAMILSIIAASNINFNTVFIPLLWIVILTGTIIYMLVLRKGAVNQNKPVTQNADSTVV